MAEDNNSNYAGNLARSIGQGITFGFGDELEARYRALTGDRSYDEEVADIRQSIDQFRETNPVAAYGSEIAGSIPTGFGLAGLALRGGLKGAAKIGALEGSIYGAGEGEGVTGTATSTALGAGLGAAGGKIAEKALDGIAPLVGKFMKKTRGSGIEAKGSGNIELEASPSDLGPMVKEAGSDGFVPLEKKVGAPGTPGEVKPVLNPATKKGPSFDDVDYYFIDDYSPLESVLANSKDILGEGKKGFTGEQLLPRLKKAGVTDAEIDASGIGAFAASNKTVKRPASDYLDYVKENGADIKVIKLPRSQAEEFSQDGRPVDAGGEEFYHENFQRFMDRDAASEVDYVELVVSNPRTPDAASRDLTHHRGVKGAYAHVRYSDHKEPQVFGSQRISRVVEENQFDVVQQQYGKVPISEKTGKQFVTLTPQKISQLNNRIDELQDTADYKAFEGFRQERLGVDAKVADLKKRQLQYESETRSKEREFNEGINDGMSALHSISKDSLYSTNRSMIEGQISTMAPNFIRNVVRDVVRQNSSKALMLNPDQLKRALQKGIDFPPDSPAFNNVVGTNTEQNLASRLRPDLDQLKNLPQGFNKVDHVALKISEAIKNNAEKSFDQGRAYYRKEAQNYPATAPGKITDVLETQNENSTTFLRGLFADLPDSRAIDFKSIVKEQEAVNVLRRENIASRAESDSLQEQALTLTRSLNEKRNKIFGSESDELVEYMYQDGFVGAPMRSTNIRFAPNQPFRNQKQAARHNIAMVVRDARQTGVDRIYFPDYRDMAGLRGQDPEAFKITYDAAPKSYIEELKKQFPDLETGKLSPDEFVENHLGETSAKYGGPEHPVTYLDLNFSGDGRLNSEANYRDNLLPRRYKRGGKVDMRSGIGDLFKVYS